MDVSETGRLGFVRYRASCFGEDGPRRLTRAERASLIGPDRVRCGWCGSDKLRAALDGRLRRHVCRECGSGVG